MKKVGFFGGSFDPVHLSHLNLAVELSEIKELDEVWFCPAFVSPFKQESPPSSGSHRSNMLRLAIEGFSNFKVLDLELERGEVSYTIDTLEFIKKTTPGISLFLLLGQDALSSFHLWHRYEDILAIATPLAAKRGPLDDSHPYIVNTRIMDICSHDIRSRLKLGLPCQHLLPSKVLDYICQYHLYSSLM